MPDDEPADSSTDKPSPQSVVPGEPTIVSSAANPARTTGDYAFRAEAMHAEVHEWAGALPHPNVFNAYPPDVRAVILAMAQDEQQHQHQMAVSAAAYRDKRLAIQATSSWRGTLVGAGLSACAIAAGSYAIIAAHPTQGMTIIVTGAVALATSFITKVAKGDSKEPPPTENNPTT